MIRVAIAADLTQVAELETELFGPDAWDVSALQAELDGPGRRFVVEADESGAGEVTGYAVSRSVGDVVDLQRIAVATGRQREGVASDLLADLLAHPGEADRMMLEVRADNDAAIAFYRRRGFTRIGARRRYYRDGADAIVLSLTLPGQSRTPGAAVSSPSQSCSKTR